jgi:hypothetical protein
VDRVRNAIPPTGSGQADFTLDEVTQIIPPEINFSDKVGGSVKDVTVQLDPSTGTITADGQADDVFGVVSGAVQVTVRPVVENGQLTLQVERAMVTPPEIFGIQPDPVDISGLPGVGPKLNELVNDYVGRVNTTVSDMGGQLQDVTIGSDGVQVLLSSTK